MQFSIYYASEQNIDPDMHRIQDDVAVWLPKTNSYRKFCRKLSDLIGWGGGILSPDKIYLVAVGSDIFITDYTKQLRDWIDSKTHDWMKQYDGIEMHIHEYDTIADAYDVRKCMLEAYQDRNPEHSPITAEVIKDHIKQLTGGTELNPTFDDSRLDKGGHHVSD